MIKKESKMSKLQILKVTKQEALLLEILLTGFLVKLETEYQKNKEDESFLKEEALSEINDFKRLIKKVEKLKI